VNTHMSDKLPKGLTECGVWSLGFRTAERFDRMWGLGVRVGTAERFDPGQT
jgi:hypothetical protein